MGRKRAQRKFPQLDASFKYAQVFYEGMHNDARTNTAIALTAAEEGACICNHVEMVELLHGGPDGATATGVRCRDNLTGEEFEVRARSIIFAGGPFTDQLRMLEDTEATPAVAGAAGTHLVLPSYYCPGGMGMLDMNTSDGRFLFFLPWQGAVVVGTTDVKGTPVTSPRPPEQVSKHRPNS
jgi:glycerol-3-phosphate dehydrogenase